MITILRAGPLTTVQDLGRPGFAHLGVSSSGALDRASHARANALVGNPAAAASLEATLRGPRLVSDRATSVALAGGLTDVGEGPHQLAAGQVFDVGPVRRGARVYVAVAGGFTVELVLGSASADLRCGLGPPALRDGQRLAVGPPPGRPAGRPLPDAQLLAEVPRLRAIAGPDTDRFDPAAAEVLTATRWQVSLHANRTGLRLAAPGPAGRRIHARPLVASTGVVAGSIQIPPSGEPIVLLAEHPVTGGYPVLAVLTEQALDLAGQLRPGAQVRFHLGEVSSGGAR